jgi:hypothetical protein
VSSAFDRFAALPRRLFFDSSTLQTILRYGEFIWENCISLRAHLPESVSRYDDVEHCALIHLEDHAKSIEVVDEPGHPVGAVTERRLNSRRGVSSAVP